MKFKYSYLVLGALLKTGECAYSYSEHGDDWVADTETCDPTKSA